MPAAPAGTGAELHRTMRHRTGFLKQYYGFQFNRSINTYFYIILKYITPISFSFLRIITSSLRYYQVVVTSLLSVITD